MTTAPGRSGSSTEKAQTWRLAAVLLFPVLLLVVLSAAAASSVAP